MTYMTPEETALMRATLGLHKFNRENPARNHIAYDANKAIVDALIARDYMQLGAEYGPGMKKIVAKSTIRGVEAVKQQPWKE